MLKFEGKNFISRLNTRVALSLGLNTKADKIDTQIKKYLNLVKEAELIFKRSNEEMSKSKYDSLPFKDNAGNNVILRDLKIAKEYLISLQNMNVSRMNPTQLKGYLNEINNFKSSISETEKLAEEAFVDMIRKGIYDVTEITTRLSYIERQIKESTDPVIKSLNITTGKDLRSIKTTLANIAISMEYSEDTIRNRMSRDFINNKKIK